MDENRDNSIYGPPQPSSAYRDALYSQAPEGRSGYGYNLAQCYAGASEPETPAKKKKYAGPGVLATALILLGVLILVVVLGFGTLFLQNRA